MGSEYSWSGSEKQPRSQLSNQRGRYRYPEIPLDRRLHQDVQNLLPFDGFAMRCKSQADLPYVSPLLLLDVVKNEKPRDKCCFRQQLLAGLRQEYSFPSMLLQVSHVDRESLMFASCRG